MFNAQKHLQSKDFTKYRMQKKPKKSKNIKVKMKKIKKMIPPPKNP